MGLVLDERQRRSRNRYLRSGASDAMTDTRTRLEDALVASGEGVPTARWLANKAIAADPELERDAAFGAAWRAAEAALPEGWRLESVRSFRFYESNTDEWDANAEPIVPRGNRRQGAVGPTPQAALEALTLALSELRKQQERSVEREIEDHANSHHLGHTSDFCDECQRLIRKQEPRP